MYSSVIVCLLIYNQSVQHFPLLGIPWESENHWELGIIATQDLTVFEGASIKIKILLYLT